MKDAIYLYVKAGKFYSLVDYILDWGWTEEMLREETPETLFNGLKAIYQTEDKLVTLSDEMEMLGMEEGDNVCIARDEHGMFPHVLQQWRPYDDETAEREYGTVRVITEQDCKEVLDSLDEIFEKGDEE